MADNGSGVITYRIVAGLLGTLVMSMFWLLWSSQQRIWAAQEREHALIDANIKSGYAEQVRALKDDLHREIGTVQDIFTKQLYDMQRVTQGTASARGRLPQYDDDCCACPPVSQPDRAPRPRTEPRGLE